MAPAAKKKTATKTKTKAKAKTKVKAKVKVKAKTKAKTKAKVKAKPKTKAQPKAKAKVKAKVKAKAKAPAKKKVAKKAVKKTAKKASSRKAVAKTATRSSSRRVSVPDEDYRPTEDEPFMNKRQQAYFRKRLEDWKDEIIRESRETIVNLQEDTANHPDLADRATSESERSLELRTRDRQRKLVIKIDQAIARIDEGTYGYCEETGEPINVRRLDARPIATLSIEAQERHERREKVYRDD
ncbi:MAG: RNA polymerase-binding protein DksA [Alphaproteobacteria bacterium]|nr:MAG: RNA polymerase-binding protein DksA [Alphaproteobacteria bacterium]